MPPRFLTAGAGNADRPENGTGKLFGRRRTIHQLFGGGKVADVLLWRNKHLSGAILAGVTVTWFLFEVAEYHFLTLLCQLFIAAMLVVFIWSNGAALLDRNPPKIPEVILSERAFKEFALASHSELTRFVVAFQNVAMGKNLRQFLLAGLCLFRTITAIASLWVLSIVGSFCSSLNLLYFVYLVVQILPFLYERYESEVDHLVATGSRDLKKLFHRFDSDVLNRIPRGPVKEKKHR